MTASRHRLAYKSLLLSFSHGWTDSISSSAPISRLLSSHKSHQASHRHRHSHTLHVMAAERFASRASTPSEAMQELTSLLQQKGQPSKKQWWERYLKNEIQFYGTPMADIRDSVKSYISNANEEDASPAQLRSLAWNMFRQPIAEQKLAAILILQEHLLPQKEIVASRDLPEIETLFSENYIADWNTTDWLCVRVLGKLIDQDGEHTAKFISNWVNSGTTLWQKRAALVAFVNLAPKGLYADIILETAAVLVQDQQRFAQTGVGWVLRSLSDVHPDRVFDFLTEHKEHVSVEGMRMATARMSDAKRKALGVSGNRKRR